MNTGIEARVVRLPSTAEIAQRAREIYLERDGQGGQTTDDWLQAEYELMQLPVRKLVELETPATAKNGRRMSAVVCLVQTAMILGASGLTQIPK